MLVDIQSIKFDRFKRQRKDLGDIMGLAESFKRVGQLNPITIDRDHNLLAGERRYHAARQCRWSEIKAEYVDAIDEEHKQLVELEENVRRVDLPWQDHVAATKRIHDMLSKDPEWTQDKTAEYLGVSRNLVARHLQIARESERNPDLLKAQTLSTAANAVARRNERENETVLNLVAEIETPKVQPKLDLPAPIKHEDVITCGDFTSWAESYNGRPFNLLHCDFPYGIDLQDSDQATSEGLTKAYDDSEETYWRLCQALAKNLNRILFPSAHVVFWFSMKHYQATLNFFAENTDLVPEEFPLVWVKSDGLGIAPDVARRPRRVYETALLLSRGDRKLVKLANNAYVAPKGRAGVHLSVKPVPVLRHFLSMVCDDLSEVLDPTCGSGSALVAAESLGAKRVVGLEIDSEFAAFANNEIRKQRLLTQASKEVK